MSDLSPTARLAALSETHKKCMTLISQLSKLSSPGTDAERTDLAQHIHQLLRGAETQFELVSDDLPASSPLLAKTGEDLKIARRQYRRALLSAKHNASAAELFRGRRGGSTGGNEKLSQEELLVSASGDVTAALRRTQQLLQSELTRSRFAAETLAGSTEALKELGERYTAFDNILGKSRVLIRDLVRKNKSERWYYEKAITMLVGLLVWIILRRIFWGPIWMLVVFPLKMVWILVAGAGRVGFAVVGGGGKRAEVSTAVTTTTGRGVFMQSPVVVAEHETARVRDEISKTWEQPPVSMPTAARGNMQEVDPEPEEEPEPETVVVGIVGGGETTVVRNTLSRKWEEEPPVATVLEEDGVEVLEEGDAEALRKVVEEAAAAPADEADDVQRDAESLREAVHQAVMDAAPEPEAVETVPEPEVQIAPEKPQEPAVEEAISASPPAAPQPEVVVKAQVHDEL